MTDGQRPTRLSQHRASSGSRKGSVEAGPVGDNVVAFPDDGSMWEDSRLRATDAALSALINRACKYMDRQHYAEVQARNETLPVAKRKRPRKRWERPVNRLKIEIALANIKYALDHGHACIRVRRSKRYLGQSNTRLVTGMLGGKRRRLGQTKSSPHAFTEMHRAGLIDLVPGRRNSAKKKGIVSRYWIGPWLASELTALHMPTGGVERDRLNGISLFLRADKQWKYRTPLKGEKRDKPPLIDFPMGERQTAMRDQMERLNRTLARPDLFSLIPCEDQTGAGIPWGDFWLYRMFNCGRTELDRQGRMYNRAGWVNLPREHQWRFLVDGYMVAHVDINALMVRLPE